MKSKLVIKMMKNVVDAIKAKGISEININETIPKLWKPFVQEVTDIIQSIDKGMFDDVVLSKLVNIFVMLYFYTESLICQSIMLF